MRTIHERSDATYGAPRIHAELAEAEDQVGRKRVARLMRAAGLVGVSRRKWICTTVRDRGARPAPDLVERNFVTRSQCFVGRGHHLHPDLGRLSLPGGGAGCLQPADRRLGDGDPSAH